MVVIYENTQSTKTKRPLKAAAIIIAIILAALLGAGITWFSLANPNDTFSYDSDSVSGQALYRSPEEIQAEIDRKTEEGMFSISIESAIRFETPTSEGIAYIENVPSNAYDMQVRITLDDTGEEVYSSGVIAPGSYIEKIRLARILDAGDYSATATFSALNRDTHEQIGQTQAGIRLFVG